MSKYVEKNLGRDEEIAENENCIWRVSLLSLITI